MDVEKHLDELSHFYQDNYRTLDEVNAYKSHYSKIDFQANQRKVFLRVFLCLLSKDSICFQWKTRVNCTCWQL